MARVLGDRGARKAGIAGFFGFVSSSCSFAALAASRSILVKGAHPVNSIAFLISSTNLVIELGIVLPRPAELEIPPPDIDTIYC